MDAWYFGALLIILILFYWYSRKSNAVSNPGQVNVPPYQPDQILMPYPIYIPGYEEYARIN